MKTECPIFFRASYLGLGLIAMTPGHTLAGNDHDQYQGAHVHGEARLQVALDGKTVDLIFHSPAANLVGFEHQPRNKRQEDQLEQTRKWLAGTPLVNTENSDCSITAAAIHPGQQGSDDDGDSHSEIEVSQQLQCGSRPDKLLVTPVPEQFPEIHRLTVEWVSDRGQGQTVLGGGDRTFELAP